MLNAECHGPDNVIQHPESKQQQLQSSSFAAAAVATFFADMSKLEVVCAAKNFKVVNVPSDGNCLFSAIAIQLGHHLVAEAAREIRAEVVSYLRNHQSIVSSFLF